MHAAWCRERHRVSVQARLHKDYGRRILRCFRTVVLLAEHRHGLSVYLCQLLLEIHQSDEVCLTDSHHRLSGGHPRRTNDIPCSILCRCESRQRSIAHLHHPAQRLPAGLCSLPHCGLRHLTAVLRPVVISCADITDVAARGIDSLLPGGDAHHPQACSIVGHHPDQHHRCLLLPVVRCR